MQHRKLDALMSSIEKIARVAAAGVEQARAVQTEPSGAKSYDNADGTRTIIGNIANGESNPSFTMATHVGDETPPGTPTGVTASSKSGVVVVEWDGTLTGGIPDDFFCVRIYLDNSELGVLREAGSVSSAKLEGGTVHSVTATAEDDACLPDGTPAHNVSAPTAAVSVTVSEGVESVAAIAQQALEVASATGQYFWHNTGEETDPIEADVSGGTGAHVTQFKREEWSDPTHENYHKGPNSLWNSLGMLFRDGLNNLLSLGSSGLAIYDGLGSLAANIVASFTGSGSTIGYTASDHVTVDSNGLTVYDGAAEAGHFRADDVQLLASDPNAAFRIYPVAGYGAYLYAQRAALASNVKASNNQVLNGLVVADGEVKIASPYLALEYVNQSNATEYLAVPMQDAMNTFDTASTTMQLTNVGSGTKTVYLERQGHIVTAYYGGTLTPTAANTLYTVGTIPSGYRPKRGCFANCNGVVNNTIVTRTARWRFLNTGAVQVICSGTGITEYPFGVSWFTDDDWPT